MKNNPALPGGSLKSKPTWWTSFEAFHHVGFFRPRWQRQVARSREDADGQLRFGDHESLAQPTGGGESAMNQATTILDIEQHGELLIVKPVLGLHDLDESALEGAAHELLERLDHSGATDVFLDLHGTDVLHSQAPQLAVELWRRVQSHGGSMAIGLI
jgi:hypothetical protein